MPQIEITDETYQQLSAFSHFSQAASEMELTLDQLADYLIQFGIDQMVTTIIASQDAELMLKMILQMGRQHPEQTYGYMADVMHVGKEINEAKLAELREQMQRRIGFQPPDQPKPPEGMTTNAR
ncbi:MAG TPA: hypothetical protein VKV05_14380 [Terriglobales bacterium]|nr:hypothetical protein [Terriglobales bacterium]